MTKLLLAGTCLLFLVPCYSQKKTKSYTPINFSADTVKHSIDAIVKELSLKHPGFYRYHDRDDMHAYIDSIKKSIEKDSLTLMNVFLKLRPIFTRIGCLHTGISLPANYKERLNLEANLLPLQLHFEANRAFVVNNYSAEKAIGQGAELLSINGRSIDGILTRIMPLIASDGYNETLKYKLLYHLFPEFYRYEELTDQFEVQVKDNGTIRAFTIPAQTHEQLARNGFLKETVYPQQLDFVIRDSTATLTVRSFSNSAIKAGGQQFRSFIDKAFTQMREQGINDLVLDLRGNTGGSDGNAVYLARYFFNQPFRYWDRIEVTEAIAKEIKGVMLKLFYRKPIQQDSIWLWQKARTVRDFDYYEQQQPLKHSFAGKTYLLTDAFCMSSCSDITAVLAYNKKAVIVGEETGGGYQGNTSGMMPETIMEPFGFALTIPLQKYVNAVDAELNRGRGTIPDHRVKMDVAAIIAGNDNAMEYVRELISKQRSGRLN